MKRRSYTAPVLAAVLIALYYIGMIILFLTIPQIIWWAKLLMCILPLAICGVLAHVLIERIREIRSGETDDLDKY